MGGVGEVGCEVGVGGVVVVVCCGVVVGASSRSVVGNGVGLGT